jgi:hypothetical protein
MKNHDIFMNRLVVEQNEKWTEWIDKIPFITFPSEWKVQIIPPYAGAMVRFKVKKGSNDFISIYLDCYENLGYFGAPYWEVYPYDGDTYRIEMANTKKLIRIISEALKQDT